MSETAPKQPSEYSDRWKGTHSKEHFEMMNRRKREKIAAGELSAKGGRRKKPTKLEARELALRELYPKALIVAGKLIDDYLETGENADKALKAAMRVIDQVEGTPKQTIKQEQTIKAIRYESATYFPGQPELEPPAPFDVELEPVGEE